MPTSGAQFGGRCCWKRNNLMREYQYSHIGFDKREWMRVLLAEYDCRIMLLGILWVGLLHCLTNLGESAKPR